MEVSELEISQIPKDGHSEKNTKIECRGLTFFYGKHQALNEVSLSFPDRQVTAIIGPSGCGKSTLIKSFNRIFFRLQMNICHKYKCKLIIIFR